SRSRTIGTARALAAMLSVALTLLAVALIFILPVPSSARGLSLLFTAFVTLNLFHRLHLTVLQADFRLRTFNWIRIAGALTYLFILVLYAVSGSGTPLRVIVALLLGNVVWFFLSASF